MNGKVSYSLVALIAVAMVLAANPFLVDAVSRSFGAGAPPGAVGYADLSGTMWIQYGSAGPWNLSGVPTPLPAPLQEPARSFVNVVQTGTNTADTWVVEIHLVVKSPAGKTILDWNDSISKFGPWDGGYQFGFGKRVFFQDRGANYAVMTFTSYRFFTGDSSHTKASLTVHDSTLPLTV